LPDRDCPAGVAVTHSYPVALARADAFLGHRDERAYGLGVHTRHAIVHNFLLPVAACCLISRTDGAGMGRHEHLGAVSRPLGGNSMSPAGYSRRQVLVILSGLLLDIFVAALDQTVVTAAMYRIGESLNGLTAQAWVPRRS
jgi:hypothetical protein